MSHPKALLPGILAMLLMGTAPTGGPPSFALFDESYASDDVPSSDAQMLIYKPRKNSTPPARIGSSASDGILPIDTEMPVYKPRRKAPLVPGSEDTAGARMRSPRSSHWCRTISASQ